jgi:F0F1-type ATP synthase delta subunit
MILKINQLVATINSFATNESSKKDWLKALNAIISVSKGHDLDSNEFLKSMLTITNFNPEQKAFLSILEEEIGLNNLQLVYNCYNEVVFGKYTLINVVTQTKLLDKEYRCINDILLFKNDTKYIINNIVQKYITDGLNVHIDNEIFSLTPEQRENNLEECLKMQILAF